MTPRPVRAPVPAPLPRSVPVSVPVLLLVAAGGVAGSLARWAVGRALPPHPGGIPWATAAVNLTGSLAVGVVLSRVSHARLRSLLVAGFLGGYTTFSTYALEVRDLWAGTGAVLALAYAAGSVVLAVAAAGLGARLGAGGRAGRGGGGAAARGRRGRARDGRRPERAV